MAMSLEGSTGEWYSSVPALDGIYHIIDEAMAKKNPDERIRAVIALGESGDPRAVRPLVECCRDSDPKIRRHAVVGLEKLKSPRAVDVLIECLKDRSEEHATRVRAASALAAIRSYSAIEGLNERYSDLREDPVIRGYIAELLQKKQ